MPRIKNTAGTRVSLDSRRNEIELKIVVVVLCVVGIAISFYILGGL